VEYSPWYGIDYDYTLVDGSGHPIKEMVRKVQGALNQGKDVRIFTARKSNLRALDEVKEFCKEQFGYELPITDKKDPGMVELWDDRTYNPLLDGHMLAGLGKLAGVLKEKIGGMNKGSPSGNQGKFSSAIQRLQKRKKGKPSYNNQTSMDRFEY